MLKNALKTYIRILQGCIAAHGIFSHIFVKWLIIAPIYLFFVHFTLFLDNIFFSNYKKIELKSPVFIFGHARSGTTLLHRVLTEADDYVTFQYWEMKFPALITRTLVKWITNLLVKLKKDVMFPGSTGHEIHLKSVEEEDHLFVLLLDSLLLLFLTPIWFKSSEQPLEEIIHDFQDHKDKSVLFLKECLKRQAYYKGKDKVVSKINASILRFQTLYKIFPDAKFIYLVRNPIEAIPSTHSLLHHIQEYDTQQTMDASWYEKRGFNRKLLREKLYDINLLLYRHFYNTLKQRKVPKEQVLVVKYDDLCNDFENTLEKVRVFSELDFSEETKAKIKTQAEKQKLYQRSHRVSSLGELGLSEKQIKQDLTFLFESGVFN